MVHVSDSVLVKKCNASKDCSGNDAATVQFRHQGLGNSIAIVEKDVLPNDEFKCITCELECSLCNLQHK
jgi:hypothetical protein